MQPHVLYVMQYMLFNETDSITLEDKYISIYHNIVFYTNTTLSHVILYIYMNMFTYMGHRSVENTLLPNGYNNI